MEIRRWGRFYACLRILERISGNGKGIIEFGELFGIIMMMRMEFVSQDEREVFF
jgi:hypothetical protein